MDQEETVTIQPLTGITVVDVSNFILGPLAGSMLGDLGADVIKVERPGGDLMRHLVTAAGIDVSLPDGGSCTVEMMNRNKRSIVIDFSTPQGKALLLALVQDTDVFIENFRPGVLDRLGLGYDDLLKINPRLIYAGASGHGRRGPEAGRPAFDSTGQARSGVMWGQWLRRRPPQLEQSLLLGCDGREHAGLSHCGRHYRPRAHRRGPTGGRGAHADLHVAGLLGHRHLRLPRP